MGDRYDITIKCVYCGAENDMWYAPTCECVTFECVKCKKSNFVTDEFKAIKSTTVTFDNVKRAFLSASNVSWSEKDVNRICSDILKRIQAKAT